MTAQETPDRRDDAGAPDHGTSEEATARRAYEISLSQDAGTPEENWTRAERELREKPAAE